MTLIELAQLVSDMRAMQKNYFKNRSQDDLVESKRLEQKVDAACGEILSGQKELF